MISKSPAILPRPIELIMSPGHFQFNADTCINADSANQANATWLAEFLGTRIITNGTASQNVIQLQIGGQERLDGQEAEGYLLDITPQLIRIQAPQPAGVFHGLQSLRQLLPVDLEKHHLNTGDQLHQNAGISFHVPCLSIRDGPRFSWRGFMLDEGRHFHGMETVKKYLDLMSLQKLNIFHWHLTEDQGWRIQIKQYPRLTGVGAWRAGSAPGFIGRPDGIPHTGFYSQADIREIVAYASARHIQVIPEIEMPGHSLAALAAYPEYGCKGGPYQVAQKWGIFPELYCPGREETFAFLQNILEEVIDLFPSRYIHIGGDETPSKRWKTCPACQQRIRTEGLGDETGLKVYFLNRMTAWLDRHGRIPIGYSEILQPGLDENTLVQYWIGKPVKYLEAMRHGRQIIMSTYMQTYLDHSYPLTPLSKAYAYDPHFPDQETVLDRQVLGLEALLWSEFVPNRKRLDYQVFPRLCAFAETGWSPGVRKDFRDFVNRLGAFEERLDILGVDYARPWQVEPAWYRRLFGIFNLARAQKRIAD